MPKKIIIRLSNSIGNQMFMYSAAYSMAKKFNAQLFVDDETAFINKENLYTYGLNAFNFTSSIAPKKLKFLNLTGYLKRKALKKLDLFRKYKNFYIEQKDKNKITSYTNTFNNINFSDNVFVEGYFETEKYFSSYDDELRKEFNFKFSKKYMNSPYFNMLKNTNSVSICIRQNRFSEKLRKVDHDDYNKSKTFTDEQVAYIKNSIDLIKSKIDNPKFFIWSNDYSNLNSFFSNDQFNFIKNEKFIDKKNLEFLDLFLMSQAKHFIVVPSTYNWWGCWLSNNKDKIVCRPNDNRFSQYKMNNSNFWPKSWIVV